jgi:hypothetical protein
MKNAKAKAAQKKQGFIIIIITFTWQYQYRRIQSISTNHGVMVTHTGSPHRSHNSGKRKRKQTHQEFMIDVEWLALEKRKKV